MLLIIKQMTNKGIVALLFAVFLNIYNLSIPAVAQTGNADSVRQLLAQHPKKDTTRVGLLLHLAQEYNNKSTDSLYKYTQRALVLSEQLDFSKGIANAYESMGMGYFSESKYDTALSWYDKAIAVAKKHQLQLTLGSIFNNIGNVYLRRTEYEQAIGCYDSARALAIAVSDTVLLAKVSSNIAIVYYKMGNYAQALIGYLKSLELYRQQQVWIDAQYSMLNISNVYYRLGDYGKALKYADSCNEMVDKYGTEWSKISILTTYSMIYGKQKKYDSALAYELQALKTAKKIKSAYLINLIQQNVAECYLDLNELDKSYDMYKMSIEESEKLQDPEGMAVGYVGMGKTLVKKGKLRRGARYIEDGLTQLEALDLREDAKDAAYTLYETYQQLGNHRKALKYFKANRTYADSLNSNTEKAKVRQMQFQFELDEKQNSIDRLEQAQIIEEKKNETQRVLLIAAFIGLLLSAAIGYLIFRNLKNLQKSKALIEQQKEEIEHQAKHLTNLNNFKDMTFSVLSHDLRSPINALSSTLMLLDEEVISPEEFSIHKQELDDKLNSVNLILDNLLLWARDQMKGENILQTEQLNLYKKVVQCVGVLKDPAKHKNVTIINNVPEDATAYADKNQTLMVLRNILSNAVKFTPENGIVTINGTTDDDYTIISITDTGVGMPPEKVKTLFDGDANSSTLGTSGEKGTGIGLMLAYRFVQQNGGEILVDSVEGKGTTFYIQLPHKQS